jgi:putative ABC transport system permease protein
MSYLDALRSAVDALHANPMRSILTTLGVIIGVAAVILVVAIGSGARNLVVSRIKSLGSNLLVLEPGAVTAGGVHMSAAGAHLTEDDVLALAHDVPGVQLAVPIIRGGVQAVHGASNWPMALYGVGPGFLAARDWQLAEGRGCEDEDEGAGRNVAVLGQTVAARLFGAESPIGQSIRVQGAVLTVLGELSPERSDNLRQGSGRHHRGAAPNRKGAHPGPWRQPLGGGGYLLGEDRGRLRSACDRTAGPAYAA